MDSENSAAWEVAGPYNAPTNATDFTTTITIGNLKPGARYTAELRNKLPSSPSSAVVLGSVEFKTAPQPNTPTKLRFATGSCIKPNFPYKPTLSPDVYGFASMLEHSNSLDMMLFLGDFIYADLPFYFGPSNEDYRRLYRQVYMADSTRKLVQRVPMLHVYDDHEIKDNWHGQDSPPMGNAMTAYNEYNGDANPDPPLPHRAYYNFTHGNVAFYAWDTRRYRTEWETEDGTNKTMLGIEQKEHFLQWLRDVNHTAAVKFVISSVPVTAAWASVDADHDTWRGYRTERTEILDMTKYVPNLVFLSGDRHEMAAVELSSGNYEFSTSPVSQFTFPALDGFKENIEGERTLHYRRPGHVKYGILDVDTLTNPEVPSISYNLYTTDEHQGKRPAWTFEVKGKPWR
ncbi:hypothetical protein GGI12_002341 [Dipsacomyces acuminosporus]|nr:hypothetical protein GGI12_002341 [Dipsacomyces acuminosporus]